MVELELHSEEAPKYHAKKLLDEIITEVNFKILVSMMILSALPSISHKAFQNGRR
jgi:hypothetical protein